MSGFRAYCDFSAFSAGGEIPVGGSVELNAAESRHLCGALRARAGDMVDVFDAKGSAYRCELAGASSKSAALRVIGRLYPKSPEVEVYLAQCLPKGPAFDEIIRQSVELGASGIYPLMSCRSVVRLGRADAEKKSAKWFEKYVEAIKQSSNLSKFEMSPVSDISDFLSNSGGFEVKLVASLRENASPIYKVLKSAGVDFAKSACVLIGPEGDLSDAEYDAAESAGFIPVKLGDNVMKCDTAAACALSVLKAFWQK